MATKNEISSERSSIWTASNVITIIRIGLVPVFVAALLAPWPEWWGMPAVTNDVKCIVAAILFVVISGTDWLDGYLARKRNEVTDFGKFMDPLADKFLVTAALIALVDLHTLPTWVVLIILAREFIVSGIRMMAAAKGTVIAASYIGKFKTVFQMIAIVLFTVKDVWKSVSPIESIPAAMYILSWSFMFVALALTIVSLVDYIIKAQQIIGLGSKKGKRPQLVCADSDPVMDSLREEELASKIIFCAQEKKLKIGTAESLTGGMIGEALTSIPGSSAVYVGGIVSYTNSIKNVVLKVPEEILDGPGAVSKECACAMASGARQELGCNIAIAVTGIAGPGGAEPDKPVGTVWIGLADKTATEAYGFFFAGNREEIRRQTMRAAFEIILKRLE